MQNGVKIIIKDMQGTTAGEFRAHEHKSIAQMAQENGIDMPVSCCAGACFVCAANILQGEELVQIDKLTTPLVDVDQDPITGKYKQVLTCIGGIHTQYFKDEKYHELVIQKLL